MRCTLTRYRFTSTCLGTLSLREGNFEQGAAEFHRALELDPSSGVAHLNLGWFV